jgi:DNA processing protein
MSAHLFPMRNRIVAGMCEATLVIESAIKGGALITAHVANSYNREVFAVPGRAGDSYSAGCNFMIRTFKASMLESGTQLLDAMNWNDPSDKPKKQPQLSLILSPAEQAIYQLLTAHPDIEIDRLVSLSGLSAGEIASTLLEMEMNNVLVALPGKRYKIVYT